VLVEQHPDQQGQRVPAEQLVGCGVLGDGEVGTRTVLPDTAAGTRPREDGPVRAVVSRVSTAAVMVGGAVVGEIGPGLLSLVGVGREDDAAAARTLARKIHELRIFPSDDGARSAADLALPMLVVSQFTLYADTRKGRRPSWEDAAPAEVAEPLLEELIAELRRRGCTVETGSFGARMQVSSVNEGPMTLLLEV
jgi:D-tyrosyl-tRNA(Tyr) deacylase